MARNSAFDTARSAYEFTFHNIAAFAATVWPWGCIIYAVHVAIYIVGLGELIAIIMSKAIAALASASVAVAWHRRVLLQENITGGAALRFGRRELRFLGVIAIILFICVIFVAIWFPVVIYSIKSHWPGAETASAYFPVFTLLLMYTATARISLAFPLSAIDHVGSLLIDAWRLSRGRTLFLLTLYALSIVPLMIFSKGLGYVMDAAAAQPNLAPLMFGLHALRIVVFLFGAAVFASAASLAFLAVTKTEAEGKT